MRHAIEGAEPESSVVPSASPVDRLEYIGDLAGMLRKIADEGGLERLSALLALAISEVEQLQQAYWTGRDGVGRDTRDTVGGDLPGQQQKSRPW
ncbi:MAG: hypothetical protein RLZ98_1621 [Pseudomonadota bacterium]|jgi:hypothetical protein